MTGWDGERDAARANGRGAVGRGHAADDTEEIVAGDIGDTAGAGGATERAGDAPGADRATGADGGTERAGTADASEAGVAPHTTGAFDTGDAASPPSGGPIAAPSGPTDVPPATPAVAGLGLWDDPVPGDDPLPSTGSLRWAPDPTEPLPTAPPGGPSGWSGPPGAGGPSGWPDPPGPAGPAHAAGWPAPSGARDRAGPIEAVPPYRAGSGWSDPVGPGDPSGWPDPPGPAGPAHSAGWPEPPETASHLSRGPRRIGGDHSLGPWAREHVALAGLAVLVAIVVVAAFLVTRDGGEAAEPQEPATTTTFPVAGDGTGVAGPIVGPTGVIGSWSGSEWVPRPEGDQPGADLDYVIVGVDGTVGTARGEAVAEECAAQRSTSETDVAVDLDASSGPPPIAVAGVAEPRPRPVLVFGTDADVYHQAAVEVAAGLGASTPPTVTQVLRVDLDGNGTEEVVVAAGHVSDPADLEPSAGDWSAVFHRRVVADGVATEVLASSVGGGAGFDHIQVATIADLNGDGIMEVALHARSASGESSSIHALDGNGVPSEVLRAGCED